VALALRDFSVFLTDDIRAHSFLALLQPQDSETLQCSKGRFAAWGPPRPLGEAQRARANDHPTHSSANLGPQAIAACSEKHPMPRRHQVNAIRMIKAGPIVKLKYHT
jgi:hypothetical protein